MSGPFAAVSPITKTQKKRLHLQRGFESQAREHAAKGRREAQEQRRMTLAKREDEEYQKLKNKPKSDLEKIAECYRRWNLQQLLDPEGKDRARRRSPSDTRQRKRKRAEKAA